MHSFILYVSAWTLLSHVTAGGYVKINYNQEYRPLAKREIPVSDRDENITLAIGESVSRCGTVIFKSLTNYYSRYTG